MAIGTPSKLLFLLLVGTFFFGDTSGSCSTEESDSILHNCLVDLIFFIRSTPCDPPCDVYNATVLCINNLTLTVSCRSTMEDEVDQTVALFGSVCTFDDFKVLCPLATYFDVPNETTTVIFPTDGDTTVHDITTLVDTTVHDITTLVDTTGGESNTESSKITESTRNQLSYTDSTLSQQGHTGSTLTQHSHTNSGMPVSTSPIDSSTQDNGADTAPRINTLACFMLVVFASVIISLPWH